ncbi:helix-turn-helix domain-containing protein [Pusillimonas sp. TS35]|uniref:IclR family transcriptional regulator n=1 Tax=Paracandidimonas lactea TaxID=2895524 RepID=UPI0013685B1A|nr:helix-turn-helix domain-containing protein [Paracandidimonas lactea]MYN14259.1 helix-turn-helix domain-containing protein [Pusillimonas sp. TS35]
MSRSLRPLELPDPTIKDGPRDLGTRAVKSAQRVLELLELLEQLGRPVTLAEIVRASDYPQSSAWMLVQTLMRMGYLCHNPDNGTYMPSLRLNMLGGWVHDLALPHSNLRLAMRALEERLGLTIVLGQRSGRYVQYAHVLYAPKDRKSQVPIGVVRPLIDTGMGYALLAQLPDDDVCAIANACLARGEHPSPVSSLRQVLDIVDKARQAGFVYSHRLQSANRASFSFALVTDPGAGVHAGLMALAVAGPKKDVLARLEDIPSTVNDVAAEFLPDVPIHIKAAFPIQPI